MIFIDRSGSKSTIYYRNEDDYGFGEPSLSDDEIVVSQDFDIIKKYEGRSYHFNTLFSLPLNLGLYEVFSFYFESKVKDDFDMLKALFKGFIQDSKYCFCLNVGATFCWFTVEDNHLKKLGTMQFSYEVSKYSVGKFMKRLRCSIAQSGINLKKVRFLFWEMSDLVFEFSRYIESYDFLVDFFDKIDGMRGLNITAVMQLLSTRIKERYIATADEFINCLNESFNILGIREDNGVLISSNTFRKDYSTCISSVINTKNCYYGVIMDCEGKKSGVIQDGISEVGGLIYCRYKNILINIESFKCDEELLIETLQRMIQNYVELAGRFVSVKVLVYGNSDLPMLHASIKSKGTKKEVNQIFNKLNIVDCKPFIEKKVNSSGLNSVAKELGVCTVEPLHDPINDSRTLFNILASILRSSGEFVV